jgi:hypothetical protein
LHKCDNPPCVEPTHLFLGDQNANMKDMVANGRADRVKKAFGERHSQAKLTAIDVVQIRNLAEAGVDLSELAKVFSVTRGQIVNIVARRSWRSIP